MKIFYIVIILIGVALMTVEAQTRADAAAIEAERKTVRHYEDKLKEIYIAAGKVIEGCE